MSTKVNGEIRQDSDTSDLYFGIETLVSYASRSQTLYPGDVNPHRLSGRCRLLP
jgi:2-keto-4-pentenoate hydratase/2-oxohepta-3-ene-1,7-dioic acid hydratase in catechol pathway